MNKEMFLRKRKMMLLLPVILVPLLTIGFYALGGGKGGDEGKGIVLTKGLNMSLPEARFDPKKKVLNKLGFYQQSEQDSLRLRERRKRDPYYGFKDSIRGMGMAANKFHLEKPGSGGLNLAPAATDVQAGELLRKLDLLKGMVNREQQGALPELPFPGKVAGRADYREAGLAERDAARAELPGEWTGRSSAKFPAVPGSGFQGDPDLDKLNTLMDKVLKVRYPGDGPLRDTVPGAPEVRVVPALTVPVPEEVMSTLSGEDKDDLETGFIDLDDGRRSDTLAENMIAAVVDGTQTLISGEAVALRTTGDAMLGGIRVPKGTALAGRATLSGERLLVTVNALRLESRVIPVSLEVVDMDGMPGIRVKGSITRDVSKESADEAVGSLGMTSVDPSAAGQATVAGIQTAKNLLSRKIRLVRVGLPGGYRVLLKNSKVNR